MVAAQVKVGVDAVLQRRCPQLLKARHLADRQQRAADCQQRPPSPERQRGPELRCGARPLPPLFAGLAAVAVQRAEPGQVSRQGPVSTRYPGHARPYPRLGRFAQGTPEPLHVVLQGRPGGGGGRPVPDQFHQLVRGDDLAGTGQQYRKHRSWLAPRDSQRTSAVPDGKRSKQAELHSAPPGQPAAAPVARARLPGIRRARRARRVPTTVRHGGAIWVSRAFNWRPAPGLPAVTGGGQAIRISLCAGMVTPPQ